MAYKISREKLKNKKFLDIDKIDDCKNKDDIENISVIEEIVSKLLNDEKIVIKF